MSLSTQQQVALFADDFEHKHYFGAAKEYEILEELDGLGKGFFIKIFFINTKVNLNKWQVTWDAIKQDINDVVGVPIVLQDDRRHPQFAIQNLFAKGYITEVVLDEDKQEASVIARILDPETITLIQKGKLKFSSPAIVARSNLTLETLASGIDLLHRFIALHLALVNEPAYGTVEAHIHGMCKGTGQACGAKLKQLSAAVIGELAFVGDCISDKIPIIMEENPDMSNDQAVAIAISMCKEKSADGIDSLTQTPLLKKLQASINRLESEFNQLQRQASMPEFGNKWGYWINARDIDVFVAVDTTVDKSIIQQCGCSFQAAETKEDGQWITVKGKHIFIPKGEKIDDVLKKEFGDNNNKNSKDNKGGNTKNNMKQDNLETYEQYIEYLQKQVDVEINKSMKKILKDQMNRKDYEISLKQMKDNIEYEKQKLNKSEHKYYDDDGSSHTDSWNAEPMVKEW